MLDICLLGTAGMVPLKNRWLTSLYASSNGHAVLIDSGEGTQIALSEAGCRAKIIDTICITHFHLDHIGGIAGMLLAMSNAGRTEDVTMIGPPGLGTVLKQLLCVAAPTFRVLIYETDGKDDLFYSAGSIEIHPFPLQHLVPCIGYRLCLPRSGKFDPEKARALGVPLSAWSLLQKGESVKADGRIFRPEDVIGPPRRGISVVYATDTRPVDEIVTAGQDADLMILEGNYESNERIDKARTWGHMTFPEAADLARRAGARELWLTHFSQSIPEPEAFRENAAAIFPNTVIGKDGMQKTLVFRDE